MHYGALTGATLTAALALAAAAETYRGIDVAPEHRCAPYDRSDYRYSQSLETRIVASIGKVYGPYTGTCFGNTGETDIEHMVATSEAHDSGLCAAPPSVRAAFASDLLNLTLAAPRVNRYSKSGKDVAEWTPEMNACWFVARTLEVRRKYALSIDRAEAAAGEAVLSRCDATTMEVRPCVTSARPAAQEAWLGRRRDSASSSGLERTSLWWSRESPTWYVAALQGCPPRLPRGLPQCTRPSCRLRACRDARRRSRYRSATMERPK